MAIGATAADIGRKTQLHQFFAIAVRLRNRSRGHGATTIEQCSAACPHLIAACDAVVQHLALFTIPWVYLRRNLSGKYRVSPLLNDPSPLHYLKQNTRIALPDGVYLYAGQPLPAPLVFTNADVSDISLANGAYQKRQFETLSYVTNDTVRRTVLLGRIHRVDFLLVRLKGAASSILSRTRSRMFLQIPRHMFAEKISKIG